MFTFSRIYINISILFAEQAIINRVARETCSDLQETVEEVTKADSEEPAQNEHNTGKAFMNDKLLIITKSSSFHQIKNIDANF